MKKVIAISSVLLGVIFLTGCGQQPVSQTQPTTPAPVAQTPVTNQPVVTQPADEITSWKKFDSKLVNLSFSYPPRSEFQEKNVFAGRNIKYAGKDIYFSDKNNYSPAFETITKDFSVTDSVPHDIIKGTLDSENSFKVAIFEDKYTKVIKKDTGIYQVTGYGNMECSPFVQSMLIVAPPVNSNLKYISFYLGNASDFAKNELQEVCTPKDVAIQNKISSILNGQDNEINSELDLAIKIAKTLNVTK